MNDELRISWHLQFVFNFSSICLQVRLLTSVDILQQILQKIDKIFKIPLIAYY